MITDEAGGLFAEYFGDGGVAMVTVVPISDETVSKSGARDS
jgi:hypothetical protein